MRVLFSLIILLSFTLSAKSQTKYSIQSTLIAVRANNPFLKTEGFNVNIAQSNITTSKLRPNPILNNQSLQLIDSKYYQNGTEWNNRLNRQVWWQVTKPFQLPSLRKSKIEVANQNLLLF